MMFGGLLLWLVIIGLPAETWAQSRVQQMVPLTIDGEAVRLELFTYVPSGEGPFPTLIFHHGSTGSGRDPASFRRTFEYTRLVEFFNERGWAVATPWRRGRGGSDGLYDEGFDPDRTRGYTCMREFSEPGADRALRDIDAVTKAILDMPFVDKSRVVVGGQSRGGILAIAYAGMRPEYFKGVINFVGGWYGFPSQCDTTPAMNQDIFKRGAAYKHPTLWLYANKDTFYPLSFSRANFDAFTGAGGHGSFHEYEPRAGQNGHFLVAWPDLWLDEIDTYLDKVGLGRR